MTSSLLKSKKLGVIGAGVMGKTLIEGLLKSGLLKPNQIWASARTEESCKRSQKQTGVATTVKYDHLLKQTEILLLCVKPKQVHSILKDISKNIPKDCLVISIATGVTTSTLQEHLPANAVIRAMPNTPAIVQQAVTVICAGKSSTASQIASAKKIFEAVGRCFELEETHFDAVTGLSGSGPAYFFLMIEALADGGVRVGLPRKLALEIVSQTMLGAATMIQNSDKHPAELREQVTTPAGCTIAGLLTMEDGKIRSVLARAVEEATRTASGLGK